MQLQQAQSVKPSRSSTPGPSLLVQRMVEVETVLEAIALAERRLQQHSRGAQLLATPSWQQQQLQGKDKSVIRLDLCLVQ